MYSQQFFSQGGRTFVREVESLPSDTDYYSRTLGYVIEGIVYLDFDADKKAMAIVGNGMFYGDSPAAESTEEAESLDELTDALATPEYNPIFQKVYHELSNIISDPHDEDKLCDRFGGYINQGITFARESLLGAAPSVEALTDEKSGFPPLEAMFSLSLQFARFGEVVMEDYDTAVKTEYVQKLFRLAQPLELARYTDSTEEKYSQINKIVFALWPYIKDVLEQSEKQPDEGDSGDSDDESTGDSSQNQQGGAQGNQGTGTQPNTTAGGGVPSPQAIRNALNQLGNAAQNTGQTTAPQNRKSSSTAKQAAKAAKQNQNGAIPQATPSQGNQGAGAQSGATTGGSACIGPSGTPVQAALDGILQAMGTRMAEDEMEQDLTSTLLAEIEKVDMGSTHKGRKVHVRRELSVTDADRRLYNSTMQELKPISKRLQKQMSDALRDLKDGSKARHLAFGSKIESKDAYRLDQKFYSNKKQPQDLPDMALAVLVDHSGSMDGIRLGSAMKAAMLLHDFATGLNIPVAICGHNTASDGINHFVYTDYDAVGKKDKYRLAKMASGSCNRDGMAIEIAANLLARRPEDVKLLIIISDGQPNDIGYSGDPAAEDIRAIVKKYKRKGVQTFAAAIGDDKDKVKGIYKDGFVDITDLTRLPKALVNLVKKRII